MASKSRFVIKVKEAEGLLVAMASGKVSQELQEIMGNKVHEYATKVVAAAIRDQENKEYVDVGKLDYQGLLTGMAKDLEMLVNRLKYGRDAAENQK